MSETHNEQWQPTAHLRFRGEYSGDRVLRVLQQKWERPAEDEFGHPLDWMVDEWRDVEFVGEA